MSERKRYDICVDSRGCEMCQHGEQWAVIDTVEDCAVGGITFGCPDEARDLAALLNDAFDAGRATLLLPPSVSTPEDFALALASCAAPSTCPHEHLHWWQVRDELSKRDQLLLADKQMGVDVAKGALLIAEADVDF